MEQTQVRKYKHYMLPVKPDTFEKLDRMRRDLPARKGTKKETWDSLLNRMIDIFNRTEIYCRDTPGVQQ